MLSYYHFFLVLEVLTLVTTTAPPSTTEDDDSGEILWYTPAPDIQNCLRKHLIIPEILRYGPEHELDVRYGNNESWGQLRFGNRFTPEQLREKPTVLRWPCRQDAFHTLIVIGLDVPTRKNNSEQEFRHWIVVNIPANNISDGETLIPYEGPGLSYGSGLHRIVFMVYEQPWRHTIHFSESKLKGSPVRPKFDSRRFAEKYDIAEPVAVNFLLCETDDSTSTSKMTATTASK